MIVGTLIRDYKNYNSLVYVPITNSRKDKLTLYTGINGVGKSAILEALNCFFNLSSWNLRKGGKQEDALIAPVFLIKKGSSKSKLNDHLKTADRIWSSIDPEPELKSRAPAIVKLIEHRDSLQERDGHYFFCLGYAPFKYGEPLIRLVSLKKQIARVEALEADDLEDLPYDSELLLAHVRSEYDFAYLPVETTAQDMTNLKTLELQRIMGRQVTDEINAIISEKTANEKSIIDQINSKLEDYISAINTEIAKINGKYKYKTDQGISGAIKKEDLTKSILKSFIEKRALKKDTIRISELSSGEQRQVLLDVLYAFLGSESAQHRRIIIAIDEPEASLHTSRCFDQFLRTFELANRFEHQTLATTHWYGFLPLCQKGVFHNLREDQTNTKHFSSHELDASFAKRGEFPQDLSLKSYFDFAASIISASRASAKKWIFCEGEDDAAYLRHFVADSKVTVVPLGGAGNVIKVYSFIDNAAKNGELEKCDSRLLFLYDTDKQQIPFTGMNSDSRDGSVKIRRLQISGDDVKLLRPSVSGTYQQTELEDCLDAKGYYEAVSAFLQAENVDLHEIFKENFEINGDAKLSKVSDISSHTGFLKVKSVEAIKKVRTIYDAIMESAEAKHQIAHNYVRIDPDKPDWIDALRSLIE